MLSSSAQQATSDQTPTVAHHSPKPKSLVRVAMMATSPSPTDPMAKAVRTGCLATFTRPARPNAMAYRIGART